MENDQDINESIPHMMLSAFAVSAASVAGMFGGMLLISKVMDKLKKSDTQN